MNLRTAFSSIASFLSQPAQPSDLFAQTSPVAERYTHAQSITRPPDNITAAIAAFRQPLYHLADFRPANIHSIELDVPHRDDRDEVFGSDVESIVYERQVVNNLSYIVTHTPRNAKHIEDIVVELFVSAGRSRYDRHEMVLAQIADDAPEARLVTGLIPDFTLNDIRSAARGEHIVIEMHRGQHTTLVDLRHDTCGHGD